MNAAQCNLVRLLKWWVLDWKTLTAIVWCITDYVWTQPLLTPAYCILALWSLSVENFIKLILSPCGLSLCPLLSFNEKCESFSFMDTPCGSVWCFSVSKGNSLITENSPVELSLPRPWISTFSKWCSRWSSTQWQQKATSAWPAAHWKAATTTGGITPTFTSHTAQTHGNTSFTYLSWIYYVTCGGIPLLN